MRSSGVGVALTVGVCVEVGVEVGVGLSVGVGVGVSVNVGVGVSSAASLDVKRDPKRARQQTDLLPRKRPHVV
ncbi:MAG: hypothetical protein ACREQQ_06540, partial [Candidatus Binatia bacterium]